MIDKIPPQAIDIEEVLLGALIIDENAYFDIKGIIPVEAFYKNQHQTIFNTIRAIYKEDGKIDILTVVDKLRMNNQLESIGGATYISQLTSRVGSASHVKYHVSIVYEKWVARELIKIGSELVEKSYSADDILDTLQDARDVMDKRILHFLGINSTGIRIQESIEKSIDDYFIREKMYSKGEISGIPSPLKKLNQKTGGFQPEQLIVIAGRPGMGKTSFAMACMIEAAKFKKKCAFFSLEMTAVRLSDKVVCSLAGISHSDYKKGRLLESDRKKAEECALIIQNWDVIFNESMIVDIEQIHAVSKMIKDRKGLDLVIIDYIQLITTKSKFHNRENEISQISRKAKIMAVDLSVPVLLLSQLNRGVESRADKRPMLSDLRESGAIEQDADIVLFPFRPVIYDRDISDPGLCEMIIGKHREGETGSFEFKTDQALTRFMNIEDIEYDINQMSPEPKEPF